MLDVPRGSYRAVSPLLLVLSLLLLVGAATVTGAAETQENNQPATVKTISGSVIRGEVQGLIVARAERTNGEVELAVFRGKDIRSIQETGIVAEAAARETWRRPADSNLPLSPDATLALIMTGDANQKWTQPAGSIRLRIIGELEVPKEGAARILPRVRVRTVAGEVSIPVKELPDPTRAAKVPAP
jgi:hypothetical protein